MTDLEVVRHRPYVPMEVVVPKILEIGMLRRPKEACGVIVPDLSLPPAEWVRELTNRSENPYNSYAIDPETVKQLVANPKSVWEDVLIWHTHPSGMVGPSRGDMKERIEGLKYLVVSLPNGEAVVF